MNDLFGKSVLAWIVGGVIGAGLARQHRIAGGILGAVVVGSVTDVALEQRAEIMRLRAMLAHGHRLPAR